MAKVSPRTIRLSFALVVLLTGLGIGWLGAYRPGLRICEDKVAQVGDLARVRICRPVQITDPPLAITVLVAAALLLPDFSRIAVPGLIELERAVERQAERQEDLTRQVSELRIAQSVRVSQVSIENLPPGTDLSALLESIAAKERLLEVPEDS